MFGKRLTSRDTKLFVKGQEFAFQTIQLNGRKDGIQILRGKLSESRHFNAYDDFDRGIEDVIEKAKTDESPKEKFVVVRQGKRAVIFTPSEYDRYERASSEAAFAKYGIDKNGDRRICCTVDDFFQIDLATEIEPA